MSSTVPPHTTPSREYNRILNQHLSKDSLNFDREITYVFEGQFPKKITKIKIKVKK